MFPSSSSQGLMDASQTHFSPTNQFFPSSSDMEEHEMAKTATRFQPSPLGLFSHFAPHAPDNHGVSIIRDMGRGDHSHVKLRMSIDPNFSTQEETLSHISKKTENCHWKWKHSYVDVGNAPRHDAVFNSLTSMESQFQVSLGTSSMENLVNIPQNSVPCKIRAKRGCATDPRSIAERERRARISRMLKKLHDVVPNMDQQTNYADMLELAVQHIKILQSKVKKLNSELEGCTCRCKNTADS